KTIRLDLADVLLRAGQKTEAVEQAKRAFDIEPHAAADLERIERIFGAAGAAADGVRAAEARAALLAAQGGPAEAVPAWLAVAELWIGQKRPDAAAAALERVLELDPTSRPAYQQLRDLHAAGSHWRDWARVCDLFAPHVADPVEKLAILKEVAGVHERKLGQKEMSFLAWCRALAEAPGDDEALAESERLARETGADEELSAVLEQVADDARGMVRAKLLLRLGLLRDGVLDDPEGAEAAYRKALEADPASPEALDALAGLFKKRGRVRDLVIALEQKLEAAAGLDEKKKLLLEVARLYDRDLEDVDEAVAALRRVLELDGGDAQAVEALSALYRREHRWGELAGVVARARDLAADDEARIRWQLQIAGLYENEIGDDEAAVEAYRTVLGLDDRRREALAGLERLYTKLDRFAELNRVYERQVQLSGDPAEQVRILAKSAGIFEEKMQDPARAIAQNEAVLGLDGGNLGAVKALERLYREQGQFEKLLTVLQHHLGLVTDRKEQVALMVATGEVWWKELSRVDRAEAIFGQALTVDPESREAVSALGRLYERSGNWNLALDMLRREARLAGASQDAVAIYVRIGAIDEDMLMDLGAAREAYGKALALDPGCLPAIRAMKGILERDGDRDGYLEQLVAEARYAEDDEKKAALWTEVGRLHQEERDDREGAARAYEEALKRQPAALGAARPLSDIYVAQQRWPDAERVLDGMVRTLEGGGDAKELCRQSYRQGYVAEKRGDRAKALASYRRAYELDSTYLPALEGLGNLLVAEGQLDEALKVFTAIIIHHRDGLTDLEVVETHWQIGEVAARLGQADRAIGSFRKALEIDQGHEPSRRSLVRLLEAAGDWEGAVEQRQRLLPALEGQARFDAFVAIGEACRDRLQDPYQAIDAFLGASRIDPTDLPVTEALLGLYRETRQGQKAADVLGQIIARPEVQADPPRAAKLHLLLAEILRDEVKDEAAALAELEKALDKNPRLPQAFAAIEEALARDKRWPELEQAYVRMIQRLPKSAEAGPARLALWKTLGELYRNVLRSDDGARMAYQVVSRADPEDAVSVELYADLSAKAAGQEGEAVDAYRQLVRLGAKPQKALSALVGLHAAGRAYDKAYSAAQVLAHLVGGASQEELAVVSRLRKYARDQASRPLDDQLWGLLLHERVKGPLADVMTLLALHARPLFVQAPKELGLNPKKDELDVAGSMLFFVNMFKYVERTLGVEPLRLFKREEDAARLQLVPTDPPGVVASAEMFRDRPKKELWFAIGKALAFKRPELFMARLMPHDQLDLVFQAACSVGTSKFVVTADPHLVEKLKRELERVLPEKVRANTLKLLARRYCEVQHPGDVRAYLDGAELTSNRAGALLAADLEIVRRGVLGEKAQVSKLRDEMKLKDLSNFCVSEDYAALREKLGLAAVVPA
ncbi:MAG TPA: tetratricopeptide repeat protein, partial [Anaeromyxobacteraceae bacterium]|nr:tetratricopeptide repeat protein [Anaeromyxobacteraceae bacterium]